MSQSSVRSTLSSLARIGLSYKLDHVNARSVIGRSISSAWSITELNVHLSWPFPSPFLFVCVADDIEVPSQDPRKIPLLLIKKISRHNSNFNGLLSGPYTEVITCENLSFHPLRTNERDNFPVHSSSSVYNEELYPINIPPDASTYRCYEDLRH